MLIEKLIEANKQSMETQQPAASAFEPLADTITIDDFAKLDLRVGKVLACQFVEGSDKLLQFTVDLGFEQRNIFSGIRKAYGEPEKLVGRNVIVVANLAPRKMRFGVSAGMIVCASGVDDSEGLFLLDTDEAPDRVCASADPVCHVRKTARARAVFLRRVSRHSAVFA